MANIYRMWSLTRKNAVKTLCLQVVSAEFSLSSLQALILYSYVECDLRRTRLKIVSKQTI